jgi:hypothetical protein
MGPGTLYGTVKRLLEAQLIEKSDERPDSHLDDERRRYYRLTGIGEEVGSGRSAALCGDCNLGVWKNLITNPPEPMPKAKSAIHFVRMFVYMLGGCGVL